jgi:hypothetical protein
VRVGLYWHQKMRKNGRQVTLQRRPEPQKPPSVSITDRQPVTAAEARGEPACADGKNTKLPANPIVVEVPLELPQGELINLAAL